MYTGGWDYSQSILLGSGQLSTSTHNRMLNLIRVSPTVNHRVRHQILEVYVFIAIYKKECYNLKNDIIAMFYKTYQNVVHFS